jgi:hypothetical protein
MKSIADGLNSVIRGLEEAYVMLMVEFHFRHPDRDKIEGVLARMRDAINDLSGEGQYEVQGRNENRVGLMIHNGVSLEDAFLIFPTPPL